MISGAVKNSMFLAALFESFLLQNAVFLLQTAFFYGIIVLINRCKPKKKGEIIMKKILSVLLCVVMIGAMLCMSVSAANELVKSYDAAKDGELLYEVKFGEKSGVYQPFIFGAGKEVHAKELVVTHSADGNELSLTASGASAGRVFYGGKVDGLKLGAGKKYTIELDMKFPLTSSGNGGFYFNFGTYAPYDANSTDGNKAMIADGSYANLYGIYGRTEIEDDCFTLSAGAGAKIPGEFVSDGAVYTAIPAAARVGDEYCKVRVEIDGYFYAVYLNDAFYDQVTLNPTVLDKANDLGITFYVYNKNVNLNVKNVKIYKGVKSGAATIRNDASNQLLVSYNDAALGAKLYDVNFAAEKGVFTLRRIANSKDTTKEVSADGRTITLTKGAEKGGTYWGSNIHGLKINADTKYTVKFKIKTTGTTSGSLGYNLNWPYATNTANSSRFNLYGNFNDMDVKRALKFANHGTEISGYAYDDMAYDQFNPAIDADGYTDMAYEIDGYAVSVYLGNADKNGEMTLYKSVPLTAEQYLDSDDLAIFLYIYNANRSISIKDCSVFKGLVVSQTYETPTTDAPTTDAPVTEPDSPVTGDNTAVILMIVAVVAMLGTAVTVKVVREK